MVCRDLVYHENEKTETENFFLACREFRLSLGVTYKNDRYICRNLLIRKSFKLSRLDA